MMVGDNDGWKRVKDEEGNIGHWSNTGELYISLAESLEFEQRLDAMSGGITRSL